MFSGMTLFSWHSAEKPAVTRLQEATELKEIVQGIAQLEAKKTTLEIAAKEAGAASLDFKKFTIIDNLLNNMNAEIKKFNQPGPGVLDRIKTLADVLILLNQLKHHIDHTIKQEVYTLQLFRDHNLQYAGGGFFAAGTTATAVALGGITIATMVAGAFATTMASGFIAETVDPEGIAKHAKSYGLVYQLQKNVDAALQNLTVYVNLNNHSLTANCLIDARTWTAIALNMHSVFSQLPNDVKSLILNEVTQHYKSETPLPNDIAILNQKLLATAEHAVKNRETRLTQSPGG